MGLPKFFKRHKKKDESLSGDSVKEDIPLPPQKPSEGSPTPPSSSPGGLNIPPPPRPHEGINPPGAEIPALPEQQMPGVPEQPVAMPGPVMPAEQTAPQMPKAPAMPQPPQDDFPQETMPAAPPVFNDDSPIPDSPQQGTYGPEEQMPEGPTLPSAPESMDQVPQEPMPPTSEQPAQPDWAADDFPAKPDGPPPFQEPLGEPVAPAMPEQPMEPVLAGPEPLSDIPREQEEVETIAEEKDAEDYDLPTFGADELKEIEDAEVNWTEKTTAEEDSDESPDASEEVSADVSESDSDEKTEAPGFLPEPKKHRGKIVYEEEAPTVHTIKGDYFVKSDSYKDLFKSIKGMKTGITKMEDSFGSFSVISKKQDEGYKKIMDTLHGLQESLMNVDSKLFEEG